MLFWECRVTHEPGEESFDGIGCFPVSPGIQVISEILESLLTPIGLLQALYNLFLVFLGTFLSTARVQWTEHICQDAPRKAASAAFWMPVWPSETTS